MLMRRMRRCPLHLFVPGQDGEQQKAARVVSDEPAPPAKDMEPVAAPEAAPMPAAADDTAASAAAAETPAKAE